MDGIHEDLNRILAKPTYAPTPEEEAELERLPPQIASDREWRTWRSRNDSLVVDFFQGQFRNRLECLTCHKASAIYVVRVVYMTNIQLFLDFNNLQRVFDTSAADSKCTQWEGADREVSRRFLQ